MPEASTLQFLFQLAKGIASQFGPNCEVVVHDLTESHHSILAIHNNLSGRRVGDPTTELGNQRIADPDFPAVVANYPNRLPDGRATKSTSIGLRDRQGNYVAALCLNIDLTAFQNLQSLLLLCFWQALFIKTLRFWMLGDRIIRIRIYHV